MKGKMSEVNGDNGVEETAFVRYDPQHPLPDGIKKMDRDETVCKYCGVSYLIHNEIKALEDKLKATEAELVHYKGCEERENKLKQEVEQLRKESMESHSNSIAKDSVISSLKSTLKSEQESSNKVRIKNKELEDKLEEAVKLKERYRLKNSLYEQNLPSIQKQLSTQKSNLSEIHQFLEDRDKKMKEELSILLSNITDRCHQELKEKSTTEEQLRKLESAQSEKELQSVVWRDKVRKQEQELSSLRGENTQLQQHCSDLQISNNGLKDETQETVSRCRHLTMENQQFQEQLRNKTQEIEDVLAQTRRKEQNTEQSIQKLQSELKKKETELRATAKELKSLENRFHEQQRKEEEIHRKATLTVTESRELKEILSRTKGELEQLKSERESMIMSHQNRIEQLRESFKQKINEADSWQDKLEEALQKERAKHVSALKSLEERLKENFVLELQIEKQKYQELLGKYQSSNKEHESLLKAQLSALENKYRAEIRDLQKILTETKERAKGSEDSLRNEIQSLKGIIQDLENRLGRLDLGNEEMIKTLKSQLQETHEELDSTRQEVVSKEQQLQTAKSENNFLQETVRRECEERFELTEKLSEAREELLQLKKPAGGYSSFSSSRQSSTLSNTNKKPEKPPAPPPEDDTSITSPSPSIKSPLPQPVREGTYTTSNNALNFSGESAKAPGKLKGGSLAENRRRIALILGRKSSS